MTPERLAIKERLAAETKARMDAVWNSPGFADEHAAWLNEHRAAAEMCKAREKAGMTQAALARRLRIPRANVSRMENGRNVTFATSYQSETQRHRDLDRYGDNFGCLDFHPFGETAVCEKKSHK